MKKVLLTLIAVPSLAMARNFEEHAAYTGAYFGLGVSASDIGQKVEYYAPTSVRFYAANDPARESSMVTLEEDVDVNLHSSQTRLAGTAAIGFGKRIAAAKGAYVSLEAGVDFGRNIHSQETDGYYEYNDGKVTAVYAPGSNDPERNGLGVGAGDGTSAGVENAHINDVTVRNAARGANYNNQSISWSGYTEQLRQLFHRKDAVDGADSAYYSSRYSFQPTKYDVKVRHSGVTPWFGLRAGLVDRDTGMLVFVKVGGAYKKAKLQYIDLYGAKPITEVKVNGLVPLVALGVEKAFGNKATIRLEAEYQRGKNKKQDGNVELSTVHASLGKNGGVSKAADATKLLAKDTITIRILLCYNIKICHFI